jgi:hypothetical protein
VTIFTLGKIGIKTKIVTIDKDKMCIINIYPANNRVSKISKAKTE